MTFRNGCVLCFFIGCFCLVVIRSIGFCLVSKVDFVTQGRVFLRGKIYSDEGTLLASTRKVRRVYLNNKEPLTNEIFIQSLCEILQIEEVNLRKQLTESKVILLKNDVNSEMVRSIQALNHRKVLLDQVSERFYPNGNFAPQLMGFVDLHGIGVSGVELFCDQFLTTKDLLKEVSVTLHIDYTLQKFIQERLYETVEEFNAEGGLVLVQDVKTSVIKAMVDSHDTVYINRHISGVLEPGSVFKVFFLAYLLDTGKINMEQEFLCEGAVLLASGEKVSCTGVHGQVNIEKLVRVSCNAAMVRATDVVTMQEMYEFLKKCGFGKKTGIDFPHESAGIIPKLSTWGLRTAATVPLGQGIAITPVQLLTSFSALINGGVFREPKIVKKKTVQETSVENNEIGDVKGRLIKVGTGLKITELLKKGVDMKSTGKLAYLSNYPSIGKTGTSQQADAVSGEYSTRDYHAVFLGAYPAESPQVSILIAINRPKKSHYGGTVAAPLYAKILPVVADRMRLKDLRPVQYVSNVDLSKQDMFGVSRDWRKMPNFVGKSFREAVMLLTAMRKALSKESIVVSVKMNSGRGRVVKQTPSVGKEVLKDMTVILQLDD